MPLQRPRFAPTSLNSALFLHLRWQLTPFSKMAEYLPSEGRILDLGCGHGLFAMALAESRPRCTIEAVDHDAARIEWAQKSENTFSNLKFRVGGLDLANESASVSAISLIDVIHYLDASEQKSFINNTYRALQPGGTLIFRTVEPSVGVRASLNTLYEDASTAIGFTKTSSKKCTFRTPADWLKVLTDAGFVAHSVACSSPIFSDRLYIAKKIA